MPPPAPMAAKWTPNPPARDSWRGPKAAAAPAGPSLSPVPAAGLPSRGGGSARFRRKCRTELEPGGCVENDGVEYRLVARLGSGCFAEVFRAQCSASKLTVAVKVLPEEGEQATQNHQKEARRLMMLRHPNVVSASDTFRFVGRQRIYTCIVMEYCAGGTLQQQIKTSEAAFMPDVINRYLYQIADGLDYLHSNGIIHGDLKSDNVLLTKRGQPKISDFGHSRRATPNYASARPVQGGDLMFAPPEYNQVANVSTMFDMWSLGCILCEMATMNTIGAISRGVPFVNNPDAFKLLMQEMTAAHGGLYFPIARNLIVTDPRFRWSASAVRQAAAEMGGYAAPTENDDGRASYTSALKWLLHKITG
eukprot:EG_transcript_10024